MAAKKQVKKRGRPIGWRKHKQLDEKPKEVARMNAIALQDPDIAKGRK